MHKVWVSGPVFHVEWLFGNGINYILTGKPDFPCFALQINVCITEEKRKGKNAININRHDPHCLSAYMFKNHPPPENKKSICISIKMTSNSKWIPLLYVCIVNMSLTPDLSYCEYWTRDTCDSGLLAWQGHQKALPEWRRWKRKSDKNQVSRDVQKVKHIL